MRHLISQKRVGVGKKIVKENVLQQSTRINWLLPLTISVLAGFLLFSISSIKFHGYGTIDPFVYLGYSLNFQELISFFGTTYYSWRISHVLPQSFFYKLFGLTTGYIVFKSLCLGMAIFFTYKMLRIFKTISTSTIWTTSTIFSSIPLASILWDHYDGTIFVYQLATLFFALKARNENYKQNSSLILVGVFMALIVNGNVWAATITFLALIILYSELLLRDPSIKLAFRVFLFVAIGFVFISLLLIAAFNCMAYDCELRSLDVFGISAAMWLLGGGGETYYVDTFDKLISGTSNYSYIFFGIPIGLATVLFTPIKYLYKPSIKWIISLCFLLQISFALFVEMTFKVNVLNLLYYVIYFFPTLILLIGLNIPNNLSKLENSIFLIFATLVFIAYWTDYGGLFFDKSVISEAQLFKFVSDWSGYLIGFLFFVVTFFAINSGKPKAGYHKLSVIIILVSLMGSINLNADMNPTLGLFNQTNQSNLQANDRDWEHRQASKKLIEIVNKTVKSGERVKFQYYAFCSGENYYKDIPCYTSIQSVYLFGYSYVVSPTEFRDYRFFAHHLELLEDIDKLVIIGNDNEIVETLKSLQKLNLDPKLVLKSNFDGKFYSFSFAVLELSRM